jgi:hypothetical protein
LIIHVPILHQFPGFPSRRDGGFKRQPPNPRSSKRQPANTILLRSLVADQQTLPVSSANRDGVVWRDLPEGCGKVC